jgi:hypothetical protein
MSSLSIGLAFSTYALLEAEEKVEAFNRSREDGP